jgi:type III restriction enzyme
LWKQKQREREELFRSHQYILIQAWPAMPYNPDWAVLVEKDGTERLYFVVETKSSLFTDDLRDKESAKIECGKAHFKALAVGETPAQFIQARNIDDLIAKC